MSRELVFYWCDKFKIDVKAISWSQQMSVVKKLLEQYTAEQIRFAIDFYCAKNRQMYSMGYLLKAMDKIPDLYRAEMAIVSQEGDSLDRNQRRLAENNETRSREKHYLDLFEKPE